MSFAKRVKSSVKEAIKFIGDFENTALQLAAEQNYDYVICGHIHRAQMRTEEVKGKKITYLNSGDWVESLTALEYKWGQWSIYEYEESDYQFTSPRLQVKESRKKDISEEDEDVVLGNISTHEIFEQIVQRSAGGKL
jgi:DNA repair exonuclease SbcCD nuclease subunit